MTATGGEVHERGARRGEERDSSRDRDDGGRAGHCSGRERSMAIGILGLVDLYVDIRLPEEGDIQDQLGSSR